LLIWHGIEKETPLGNGGNLGANKKKKVSGRTGFIISHCPLFVNLKVIFSVKTKGYALFNLLG
jgi:hypothetical protein